MGAHALTVDPVASRLIDAIEGGDVEGVRACFHPDAVVWHNDDQREVGVDHTCRVLGWLAANVDGMRYDSITRRPLADGYLQQHVLRGTTRAGGALALAACLVVTVSDGLISRIDEYYDSAAAAVLRP